MNPFLLLLVVGLVAAIMYFAARFVPKKVLGLFVAAAMFGFLVQCGFSQTDAAAMTATATTAFTAVATLCVSIGTFFVVYRIVKKIR
jgi:C4-dicarboxylate transporter